LPDNSGLELCQPRQGSLLTLLASRFIFQEAIQDAFGHELTQGSLGCQFRETGQISQPYQTTVPLPGITEATEQIAPCFIRKGIQQCRIMGSNQDPQMSLGSNNLEWNESSRLFLVNLSGRLDSTAGFFYSCFPYPDLYPLLRIWQAF